MIFFSFFLTSCVTFCYFKLPCSKHLPLQRLFFFKRKYYLFHLKESMYNNNTSVYNVYNYKLLPERSLFLYIKPVYIAVVLKNEYIFIFFFLYKYNFCTKKISLRE